MADEFLRSKLYEYVANSNLVLEAERDGRRRSEAGKGEVESLRGKVSYFKMGDRLGKSTTTFDSKLLKRSFEESDSSVTNVNKHFKSSAERNRAVGHYVPQSAETRIAFEELLVEIRNMVGDLPHDDMLNAATEVLTVLKSSNLPEKQKISEIGALVGQVISINKIASIANRINDLANASSIQPLQHANEEEMAVVFDDDDDHDGGMVDEEEEEEEGNEEGQEEPSGFGIKQDSGDNLENSALKSNTHQGASSKTQSIDAINIHEVDAYWLQGRLSKYYDDANVSSRVADEVLRIISERDERLCESQLVALLGFDKFDLIKILLRNRAALYYCIRLKRAQTVEETQLIENEMKEDVQHGGALILSMLQSKTMVGGKPTELPSHPATGGAENRGKSEVQFSQGSAAGAFPAPVGRVVNLDEYVFTDGGHLLSNPQCTLPEQSWRAQKKGYEEVHVPALKSVVPPGEKLVLVSDLPDWMQPVFDGMRSFNRVQSKLFNSALNASKNMLLCAPTGSGKTNVALLCMLGLISKHRDQHSGLIRTKDFKIVYVAPMKALVQECVQTFGKKLSPLGINVRELSGDQSMSRQEIVDTQVIVTTPEKWDVITRKVAERSFLQLVKLVIIDEVHLLHDDRGPVLEALVARIIRNAESTISPVRIVGLSATLPNYKDVAAFLRVDQDDLHFFDNSYRPVPLQQQYIGVMEKKSLKRMQLMNEICYEKVLLHGTKNQVLIFTHSRADTVKTAKAIRDLASSNDTLSRFLQEGSASSEILKVESANAKNQDLKELLMCGFAVHHAGLSRSDRTLVEDLFADKHIKVLVSTATLAWGVNLPCRTVIIKGTQMYSPNLGRWTELSPLDILQMMGRAGRFGLDSEGEGIIITEHSELQYYLSLMNQQLPIESHMISKLPDLLNAEIVLGTISSLSEAVEWLGYTYLFVRMLRKPNLYGTSEEELRSDPSCLRIRGEFAHAAVSILEKHGLLRYDRRTGNISPTSLGKIASYYYLTSESASLYNETLRPSMTEVELFRLFSLSAEFKQVHVRDEEKLELRSLLQRVPVPVKESVDEPSAKVNVLLQAYISRLRLDGFALCADMIYIQQSACRLWRALYEIALKKEWSALSLRILEICIMTERRIWRSQSALRQFTAIPEIIIRKIEKVNAFSWEKYGELSAQDLGELVKLPKMGKTLHKFVHMVPKVKVSANVYPLSRALLRFEVSAVLDFEFNEQVHGGQMLFWLTVEDADREKILYLEPFLVRAYTTEYLLDFNVSMLSPLPPHYFLTITSDRWLHSTSTTPVSFKNLFLPPRFPPPSELLDLQPLPVSAFNEPLVESFFHPLQTLNPIQTQTHNALFGDSQNVLVCAPHGSGKTLCGELAILRVLLHGSVGKVVCIQSNQDQASILLDNWTEKFSKIGYSVCMLEGDQLRDLEAIKRSRVVISSPGFWESVSRKWRQRKVFRSFELFLFDDIHTIAGERGAVYETVICRTRFMITQLQNNARIVGLSYCIANARDMGDVLGVRSDAVFNFSPTSRPTPLDVRIVPLDEVDVSGRLQAMMKPISRLIAAMDKRSNIIVFCPSRKHGHMLAVDLVALMAKKGSSDASMNNLVYPNQDEAIAQTLKFGVCCLHECLSSSEISLLFGLFNERKLQCMIVPFSLAYKVSLVADQVVIADAVSFDGIHNRFFDLRAMDLWQMIGRAGRRESQSPGRVQIFCHSSRKERLRMLIHDLVPIESQLDHNLHDLFNAEIAAQTITSKADAVDLLTWTFYYRRLAQNPNFYGLRAAGHQQLSDHLSELVETVINDLEECKCISVENDMDVSPLNYGMIAAFYGVSYATIELFSSSISEKTKFRAMSEILCASKEVGLPIRPAEDVSISTLASSFNVELDFDRDSAVEIMKKKAYILLQSHFNRVAISTELRADQLSVLKHSVLLVQAMVDVISSQGWLKPALVAMEVSQCVVQGMRLSDPVLGQVPHLSSNLIEELGALEPPVETVYDLLDMEDAQREHYLRFSQQQLSEIAEFCNSYPSMQVTYDTSFTSGVEAGAAVSIQVTCSREIPDDAPFEANVVSSRYPYGKKEAWWIVVGDPKTNVLFSIKRFIACGEFKTVLDFNAPSVSGDYKLALYLICDSYVGCDQEYELPMSVV